MNNHIDYSTAKRGITATSQAERESGGSKKISPQPICPHCHSSNLIIGAGKKPGEKSRRCGNCKTFLGYSPLAKLKIARRRKELTNCLEILENQGIQGDLAIFTLSLASDGGEG